MMKWQRALLAGLMALALCMLTGCAVDLDELAQEQAGAIVECIRQAELKNLVSNPEAEILTLVRARLEDSQAAKETRFTLFLPLSVVTSYQPDWDAVHQRLAAFDPTDLLAMRQSYEDALNASLAAGEGTAEQTEYPLAFVVTQGDGGKWSAAEETRFAALASARESLAESLSWQSANQLGPGADAVTAKLLPGARRFLDLGLLLGDLTYGYPMFITISDFSPLVTRRDNVKIIVRFSIPDLGSLGEEEMQALLQPYLTAGHGYTGEHELQSQIREEVITQLAKGQLKQTRRGTISMSLAWDGEGWSSKLDSTERGRQDVRMGQDTLSAMTLDGDLRSQLSAALDQYYTTKSYDMLPRLWQQVSTLKKHYAAKVTDGVPMYTPKTPKPGCVLLVTDDDYAILPTDRQSLVEAFGDQVTFVDDPDLASAVLLYTQKRSSREYTGNVDVYATTLRLQACSLVGNAGGVFETAQIAEPASTLKVQSNTTAYYERAPRVSELKGLTEFVKKLAAAAAEPAAE